MSLQNTLCKKVNLIKGHVYHLLFCWCYAICEKKNFNEFGEAVTHVLNCDLLVQSLNVKRPSFLDN